MKDNILSIKKLNHLKRNHFLLLFQSGNIMVSDQVFSMN